jgi:formylglycine-generating enzyme required for sulfatase activity
MPVFQLPQRLADLGFVGQVVNGVEVIIPPVCVVSTGLFLMGSDKQRDPQAHDDELPQTSIPITAFHIARYPVTVAEYACYLQATKNKKRVPADWAEQLARLDHPVVSVSWDDATVYAQWLTQTTQTPHRMGHLWRLPTEAEWEKVARGTDGRIYPWGDTWDESCANTADGGPDATTPVGSYPSGASPYGAQDIAGNVCEWTSSLYRPYFYDPATSEDKGRYRTEVRVLRGGAWDEAAWNARAARRDWDWPDVLYSDRGFRLARSQ